MTAIPALIGVRVVFAGTLTVRVLSWMSATPFGTVFPPTRTVSDSAPSALPSSLICTLNVLLVSPAVKLTCAGAFHSLSSIESLSTWMGTAKSRDVARSTCSVKVALAPSATVWSWPTSVTVAKSLLSILMRFRLSRGGLACPSGLMLSMDSEKYSLSSEMSSWVTGTRMPST